jgi:hypothetical protein
MSRILGFVIVAAQVRKDTAYRAFKTAVRQVLRQTPPTTFAIAIETASGTTQRRNGPIGL